MLEARTIDACAFFSEAVFLPVVLAVLRYATGMNLGVSVESLLS